YPAGVTTIDERNEARVQSEHLRIIAAEHGLAADKHQIPESVFKGSEDMQRGFLQALFTADGSFQNGGEKGGNVRLAASKITLLESVQQLLLNFGVASRIYRNRRPEGYRNMPDGKGGLKEYPCQAQHELVISKASMRIFADEIGFLPGYKQDALENYISCGKHGVYAEKFLATVESISEEGIEEVFDLTEPLTSSFTANGIIIHNCGEQYLGPFENCCLGSVNLAQHYTDDGRVDWEKLRESVELSTRFLDHVVTANAYVPAVPQLREAAERVRRIGLGIMGLGDMMYALGVRYGSREGQEFASQIMEFVRYHSMATSIELARKHGAFPAIKGSRYDPEKLKWTIPQPLVEHISDWNRPALDWDEIERDLKRYGIRNG
ncbi:MAG TPA: LAGLIDADG family homing endonuclease, partial [Aggregatilineales bacterium]|nr:LAGLIDADG family homing endonuclease [Aggregatilineales bacterium]